MVLTAVCSVRPQLKSFHNELLTQLEQKVELDSRYLSVSSSAHARRVARAGPPAPVHRLSARRGLAFRQEIGRAHV